MNTYDISREDLFAELEKDLRDRKPLIKHSKKVRLSPQMEKDEFSIIRKSLSLTQAELALHLDVSVKTIQAYEQGRCDIPGLVAKVLRLMGQIKVFKGLMLGKMLEAEYSEYGMMKSIIDRHEDAESKIRLAETILNATQQHHDQKIKDDIEATISSYSFLAMKNTFEG